MTTEQPYQSTKRKYRGREEKRQIVCDYEASGMTQKEFCQERDIPLATFCTWLRKYRQNSVPVSSGLLPVRLINASDANGGAVVVALPDGIEIKLPETATVEQIVHLIKNLRSVLPC